MTINYLKKHKQKIIVTLSFAIAWECTWMLSSAAQPSDDYKPAFPQISHSIFFSEEQAYALLLAYDISSACNIFEHLNEVIKHIIPGLMNNIEPNQPNTHSHSHSHSHASTSVDTENNPAPKTPCYKFSMLALILIPVTLATLADYYQFQSLEYLSIALAYFTLQTAYNIIVEGLHLYSHAIDSDFMQRSISIQSEPPTAAGGYQAIENSTQADSASIKPRHCNPRKIFSNFNLIVITEFLAHIATAALFADRSPEGIKLAATICGALTEAITHADDVIYLPTMMKKYCKDLTCNWNSARKIAALCIVAPLNGLATAIPPILMLEIQLTKEKKNTALILLSVSGILGEFINGYANALIRIGKVVAGLKEENTAPNDTTGLTAIVTRP